MITQKKRRKISFSLDGRVNVAGQYFRIHKGSNHPVPCLAITESYTGTNICRTRFFIEKDFELERLNLVINNNHLPTNEEMIVELEKHFTAAR